MNLVARQHVVRGMVSRTTCVMDNCCVQGHIGGSVLIGQVIVRQQRMKPQPCDLPYQYMTQLCHYDRQRTDSDTADGEGKKGSTVYENYGYYEGDGYLVTLGDNR